MRRARVLLPLLVLLGWLLCALLAKVLPLSPNAIDLAQGFAPPAAAHWLGTDELGRSIAARVVSGARVSCGVGLAVMLLSLGIGVGIGVLAALAGGWVDACCSRLIDIFMALEEKIDEIS